MALRTTLAEYQSECRFSLAVLACGYTDGGLEDVGLLTGGVAVQAAIIE